ncbi:MAG: hypothetical protein ABFC77_14330 [Thermoguttaceae bacterium]
MTSHEHPVLTPIRLQQEKHAPIFLPAPQSIQASFPLLEFLSRGGFFDDGQRTLRYPDLTFLLAMEGSELQRSLASIVHNTTDGGRMQD